MIQISCVYKNPNPLFFMFYDTHGLVKLILGNNYLKHDINFLYY